MNSVNNRGKSVMKSGNKEETRCQPVASSAGTWHIHFLYLTPKVEMQLTRGHEVPHCVQNLRWLYRQLRHAGTHWGGGELPRMTCTWIPCGLFRLESPCPFLSHLSDWLINSKRMYDWSLFVPLFQIQRLPSILFLRPPIKWERKLESKHSESPDLNLCPETTRRGCLSLKELF